MTLPCITQGYPCVTVGSLGGDGIGGKFLGGGGGAVCSRGRGTWGCWIASKAVVVPSVGRSTCAWIVLLSVVYEGSVVCGHPGPDVNVGEGSPHWNAASVSCSVCGPAGSGRGTSDVCMIGSGCGLCWGNRGGEAQMSLRLLGSPLRPFLWPQHTVLRQPHSREDSRVGTTLLEVAMVFA